MSYYPNCHSVGGRCPGTHRSNTIVNASLCFQSTGGGSGKYLSLDGDLPLCIKRVWDNNTSIGGDIQVNFASISGHGLAHDSCRTLTANNYNVHSLMRFDERIERILLELGDRKWDLSYFHRNLERRAHRKLEY